MKCFVSKNFYGQNKMVKQNAKHWSEVVCSVSQAMLPNSITSTCTTQAIVNPPAPKVTNPFFVGAHDAEAMAIVLSSLLL
jgi:hypothetical protein